MLYVTAVNEDYCAQNTLAVAHSCDFDVASGRPLSGMANFCPSTIVEGASAVSDDGSIVAAWGDMLDTAVHETLHALYFSSDLFVQYVDADGSTLLGAENVVQTWSQATGTVTRLVTPRVAAFAQDQCVWGIGLNKV